MCHMGRLIDSNCFNLKIKLSVNDSMTLGLQKGVGKLGLDFQKLSINPSFPSIICAPKTNKSLSEERMLIAGVPPQLVSRRLLLLKIVLQKLVKPLRLNNYKKYNLMKRTKETYFRDFPTENETNQMSGCREFQGQDLKYDSRRQFFKNKQKQWLDQQIEEKKQRAAQQKFQQQLYDQQTLELNRMRGMLEDNFQQTKKDIQGSTKSTNQQLDLQRKQKQRAEKQARLKYERQQAEYLKQRGQKQQFYKDVK